MSAKTVGTALCVNMEETRQIVKSAAEGLFASMGVCDTDARSAVGGRSVFIRGFGICAKTVGGVPFAFTRRFGLDAFSVGGAKFASTAVAAMCVYSVEGVVFVSTRDGDGCVENVVALGFVFMGSAVSSA
eukprot:Cvel_17164.t1-p1 / transcript=Cvel_17164.t1 / gene=Cvel_17164 / organism=Chromera_velia_CCMP2878 / gene_product=Zinc finger protein 790, putative / transcript_product=Zinc finger protein 790, putative / location=Cvel_scaffold1356:37380-37766(-) / protein_length=129 / sequence_SO=supercontig / SO=protein_coding / is_pseudo=false